MEQIITSFFFKNKYCPFPGVGTLSLSDVSAQLKIEDHQILSPRQLISFTDAEKDAAHFIEFISRKCKVSKELAAEQLIQFCNQLKNLDLDKTSPIEGVGVFFKNDLGQLHFKQQEIDDAYFPVANASRVIHPSDSHQVLVGDKTVSSEEMIEELNAGAPKSKRRIWIVILILFILLAAATFAVLWFAEEVEQATGLQIPFRIR
jgi:hypothetical protein